MERKVFRKTRSDEDGRGGTEGGTCSVNTLASLPFCLSCIAPTSSGFRHYRKNQGSSREILREFQDENSRACALEVILQGDHAL